MEWDADSDIWSVDAWSQLVNDAGQKDLESARILYERYLKQFPTASRVWASYANLEIKNHNFERVESIFARCLQNCLHIDLWKVYVGYIKTEKKEQIEQVYQYALDMIGFDISSAPLWLEYIQYLKSLQSNVYLDAIRQTYFRAIVNPIQNIEGIWRDYDVFENSLNKITAKKLLAERSTAYMTARAAFRERRSIMELINRNQVAKPPRESDKNESQYSAWKQLIAWEKRNPLHLDNKDTVLQRVMFTYKQALLCLRYFPDVWFEAIEYLRVHLRHQEATDMFMEAAKAMPMNVFLSLSWADDMESSSRVADAKNVYEKVILRYEELLSDISEVKDKQNDKELDKKGTWLQKFLAMEEEYEKTHPIENDVETKEDGEEKDALIRRRDIKKQIIASQYPRAKLDGLLESLGRSLSLLHVHFMRFARRSESVLIWMQFLLQFQK